ncbi:pentatricopeptide repeat-containing protein At2g46050, mitochondrial [Euphorbia lathyris]|uniref:pentatricopeptide repeat-containing protein At2g46050, mitochondrial n=1 Tax=Euphorbia lathyris TaxID=212925 RepID=UPI003313F7F1
MYSKTKTSYLPKTLSIILQHARLVSSAYSTGPIHFNDPCSLHSFCSKALKFSAKSRLIGEGKQIHAHLMKLGLYNVLSLQNQLLKFYLNCNGFDDARRLFDEMSVRNVVTLNTVICGLVDCGSYCKSNLFMIFTYFKRMLLDKMNFDSITFNGLLRACLELNDICSGRQLHCFVVKLGFESSCFVSSALVDLYGKCGFVTEARCVFDKVVSRDVVLWNVMLSCYAFNCLEEEAFRVFNLMRLGNLMGDGFTFSSMLNSCANLGSYALGRQIHGLIIKLSFNLDILVATGLVDMYAKSETIEDARKVFDYMDAKNVVSWNTMVVAYGQQGDGKEAMKLLEEMLRKEFSPDELTLASVFSSASTASASYEVMQVHAYVVKIGVQSFLSIGNAMISAYSKCGRTASALECFNSIPEPNLITWTSLISAYAFSNLPELSIKIFETMLSTGVRPDRVSFLGVLSACSHAGFVKEGLQYFKLMINFYKIFPDVEHCACLVDLLGRAGLLDEAFIVLSSMPVEMGSDTLRAFIGACKLHGHMRFAKWAAEKLSELEPNIPVNYALMSNIYASRGQWDGVAKIRKLMRDRCDHKIPGCSWMELNGVLHTFVSSDKFHPQALEMYCMLELLLELMRDEHAISELHSMPEIF